MPAPGLRSGCGAAVGGFFRSAGVARKKVKIQRGGECLKMKGKFEKEENFEKIWKNSKGELGNVRERAARNTQTTRPPTARHHPRPQFAL